MTEHHSDWIARIVRYFAESKLTPLLIGFSVLVGGFAVANLPREEEPQISVPMFDVFVRYPGASAEEVEQRVVNLGERKLWEIPGVEYIYSTAESDRAMIVVRFKVGEDVDRSLIKLYTKVFSNLDFLPQGASQPLIKLRSIDDVPVLALTLYGKTLKPLELRRTAAELQTILNAMPDVSETTITGGRKRQFQVFFDEGKLKEHFLSPSDIGELIRQANVKMNAGHVESAPRLTRIEADSFFASSRDLENLVVGISRGSPVYLKDIAKVKDGPDEEDRSVTAFLRPDKKAAGPREAVFGEGLDAVTLSISKRKGTNATELCGRILKQVKALEGSVIPKEVSYLVTRDYGKTAEEKSNELLYHMAIAVLGVSVLIALMLGWRESGVVAIAIPMTLSLTLAAFYFFGFTLNRITLFALIFSIGILVDDPIVDLENIVRHFRMPRNKGKPLLDVTIEAVNEVRSPLILATLTVIAAILPMAFVRGLMGPYMRPIPIGASSAMFFSMAVAFVATPWAAHRILSRAFLKGTLKEHGEEEKEGLLTRFYRSYMRPLIYEEKVRRKFIRVLAWLTVASVMLIPLKLVKVKMLPFDNKNEFQVIVNMPEGTPIAKTRDTMLEIVNTLKEVPEVKNIQMYAGCASPYNFNGLVRHYFLRNEPHQADLQVNLVDKNERKRQSHAIAQSVRPKIHEIIAKAKGHVQVAEVPPGPPVLSTLVLEIYGPTLEGQKDIALKIEELLKKNPGVTDVDTYERADEALLRLKIDGEKATLNGINVSTIASTIAEALNGEAVDLAHLPSEKERVEIVLRLPKEKRSNLNAVLEIPLLSRFGNLIPIRELVREEPRKRDQPIYHKNLMRVSYVLGDVTGRLESPVYAILDLTGKIKKLGVKQLFTGQPKNTEEWVVKWDGEWQITYEVFRDLGIAFAAVLVLIYILIVGWFKSYKAPLAIMLPIPLTLVGILPAHWFTNSFFTATSMIGLIAGAGIVVRNSIILVDFIQLRLQHGLSLEEAVIDAGAKRFRPMLLTAAAVVVGASVILFDPIFQGLALSLMAGEIASTILSRTAVPVIYYMMMKGK